ncbi:MAG: type antifreeze protein [Chloroflexota bacterium]|nr:type antifreeze protein [Chloroflexota bacterium]
MPLYDYVCAACGRRFEVIHGIEADPPASCPLCGDGPVRKAITAPTVHYRGSGWAKKERRAAVKTSSPSGGSDDGSSDGGASKDSGSSGSDTESSPAVPTTTAPATADSSKGTSKPSKSGTATKTPTRDAD